MKLLALFAIVAICNANIGIQPSLSNFKNGKVYTYNYVTVMEVPNPLKINLATSLKVNTTVDLWFHMDSEKRMFKVVMKMRNPELKVLKVDPMTPEMPLETIMQLKAVARQHLLQPVVFMYDNGIIRLIKHVPDEELWSVNLKKGLLNLLHIDVVATSTKEPIFEKVEVSIHGLCVSTYSIDSPLPPLNNRGKLITLRKTIDVETCNNTRTQLFSNVLLKRLQLKGERTESPLKALTSITYKITKTSAGFKIIKVNAEGHVMFNPTEETRVAFKALTYQTLSFIEEKPFAELPGMPSNLKDDTLIMTPDVVVRRSTQELEELRKVLMKLIKDLNTEIKDISKPLPEKLLVRCVEIVKRLRELPLDHVRTLWKKIVEEDTDQEIKDWFVHVLTMVGTENSMKVALNALISKPTVISTKLVTEFMSAMSLTPFVTEDLIKKIEQYCLLPIIANDKTLKKTCMLATANAMRSYCGRVRYCKVSTPKALLKVLEQIEAVTEWPPKDLTAQDILEYFTIAETVESPEIVAPLLKIMRNMILPIPVRVQAIMALVKLAPKLKRQVTEPMLKVYRDINLPEEMRLAALKVILEYPEPTFLMACVQNMRIEPSLNIRRHFMDILATEHIDFPTKIIDGIKLAKEVLHKQKVFPVPNRIFREYFKSHFFMSKGAEFLVKRSMYYTNRSVLPRNVLAEMDLRIMGRRVNLVGIEWRTEGLNDLLQRLSAMVARYRSDTAMPEKLMRLFKQIEKDAPVLPTEEFNMLLKLNILGRPYLTTFKAVPLTAIKEEDLKTNFPKLIEMAAKLRQGYEIVMNKIMMPAEMIVRMPTCGGMTLVHDFSTILMTKTKSILKTTTTPDMFSLKTMIFSKPLEHAELALKLHHSSSLLMQGSAFFNLPFVKFGAEFTQTYSLNNANRFAINFNFRTMEHKTTITAPKIEDIMGLRSDSGNFLWMEKSTTLGERLVRVRPEYIREELSVISKVLKPDVRLEDTVQLRINSKYVSVANRQPVLTTTPTEWRLVHHGRTGRVVSLLLPKFGYLAIKPKSKVLIISKSPFYWLPKLVAEKEMILQALVPAMTPPAEGLKKGMLYKLYEFAQVYQQEEIDVKEIENVHRMFNEDLFAYEVQIGTLGVNGNQLIIVAEEDKAVKISVLKPSLENLKMFAKKRAFCLGEDKRFNLCFYGIHTALPIFERSWFESLFMPTFLKVAYPPHQSMKAIEIQNSQVETEKNKLVYKLKIRMEGTAPEYVLLLKSTRQLDAGKITIVLRRMHDTKEISKLMCLNMDMYKDSLSLRLSLDPQCQQNHFTVKTFGSPIVPRRVLRFDWLLSTRSIPDTWFTNSFARPLLRKLDKLSAKLLPIALGEYVHTQEFYPLRPLPIVDTGVYNGSIEVRLTTNKDAKITLIRPTQIIMHRLMLPFEIYELPMGSIEYPLINRILKISPNCFHGRNFFNTFDGVEFNYHLPKGKCEHVLLRNTDPLLPGLVITVRRSEKQMRIVRMVLESTEILIKPKKYDQMPIIQIDGKEMTLKGKKT